ncbi:uncharacterized protein [Temnothorax nylanderi]|uniref:uncharacterized protein n=1 Tax=Temnothorax nylanderi TaxID=102681 RepID=UPI003A8498E5
MHLQELGAIESCTPCKSQFISTYFLVDKPNGDKRFILNLKKLNKFIKPPHFKLEDIRTAVKLISPGCFMAKLDLKDAYFLVPVHHQDRKFLRFLFRDLPDRKRLATKNMIERFQTETRCTIREFASLIGTLISCCPAIAYGTLYSKNLESEKQLRLIINDGNFETRMTVPRSIQSDLEWWHSHVMSSSGPIRTKIFSATIFTDASMTGWGAAWEGNSTRGLWSADERTNHINFLELLAISLALKCFAQNLSNCEILLRVDNTTAISYINRMGSTRVPKLNRLAREIWQWCESKSLWLFASYIPSKENTEADRESRYTNIDTEWELADYAFNHLVARLGKPEIDLFASRINAKCKDYYSWRRDPCALSVDAFTISWSDRFFYAFPPFSLVLPTLRKIFNDQATGIVVVPQWTAQPWYPLFLTALIEEPIIFKPSMDLLRSPCRTIHHPLANWITLVAGKLSGRRT